MSLWQIVLLVVAALTILAFRFLPWYVLLGIAVVLVIGMKLVGKRAVFWLVSLPFRAKGAVLRHATAVVHSVTLAPAPERPAGSNDDDNDDEDHASADGPRDYYAVDVTVTPQTARGAFQHWEIGELALVEPDQDLMSGESSDNCVVTSAEVHVGGKFVPDEGFKLPGKQRLRLLVGAKPEVRRLVFQYYFEKFGDVTLPAVGLAPAPAMSKR